MEHVRHEAPDAGCVGGDCSEARDATDGIAASGLREDSRGAYPLHVPTCEPSSFARPAAHLGQDDLVQR